MTEKVGPKTNRGGKREGSGRKKGTPNKLTGDIKAMVKAALDQAGGVEYLVSKAHENPVAFLSLVGKLIPHEITGEGGGPIRATVAVEFVPRSPS